MIYFSELKGKRVVTEDQVPIGSVEDIVFLASEQPKITKFVIRTPSSSKLLIPITFIHRLGSVITVKKNFIIEDISINEMFVLKNLLDKQIIDLKGNKVVRVNDVVIQDKDNYYIAGVDIGFLGMLRWFGLEKIYYRLSSYIPFKVSSKFLSWAEIQPLELSRGKVVLNVKQEKLTNLHPADLADYLEKTNIRNMLKIISLLDKNFASKVISELNPHLQVPILKKLGVDKTVKLLAYMDPDEAVDTLARFSSKRKQQIIDKLDRKKRAEIDRLIKYSDSTVGKYLSNDFLVSHPQQSVRQTVDLIHKTTAELSGLYYVYVVNEDSQLVGVLNLHELLTQDLDTPLYKCMIQNVITCHLHSPIRTVMRKMIKYHLYGLPVIDINKKIVGMIKRGDIGEAFIAKI